MRLNESDMIQSKFDIFVVATKICNISCRFRLTASLATAVIIRSIIIRLRYLIGDNLTNLIEFEEFHKDYNEDDAGD